MRRGADTYHKQAAPRASGEHAHRNKMAVEKSKDAAPQKLATETKAPETKATETKATDAKADTTATDSKPEAAPKRQGMGEGQKPVSKAYKDNWNDIFGKKKKR